MVVPPFTMHACVFVAYIASWTSLVVGEQAVGCQEDDNSCAQAATSLLSKGKRSELASSVDEQSQCDGWNPKVAMRQTCHPDLLIKCTEDAHLRAVAQEKLLAAAFNAGKIQDIPGLYSDDAILVPPNMDFVQGSHGIQAVFGGLRKQLKGDAEFTPINVSYESDVILEIGKATIGESFTSTYYVRHVCDGDAWKIETDILSINQPCNGVGTVPRNEESVAMKVALEGEKKLAATYNNEQFDVTPALYSRVPTVVPPGSERLFEKYEIGPLFRGLSQNVFPEAAGEFKPLRALEVNDVIHEIGLALFDGTAKTVYYVRHAKECGSGCKLFADIFAVCLLPKTCYDITDSFPEILEKFGIGVYDLSHDEQRNACIRFNYHHSRTGVARFQRMNDHQNRGVAACILTLKQNGYSDAKLKRMSDDDQRNNCINIAHKCSGQSIPHLQRKGTLEISQLANQGQCCAA